MRYLLHSKIMKMRNTVEKTQALVLKLANFLYAHAYYSPLQPSGLQLLIDVHSKQNII